MHNPSNSPSDARAVSQLQNSEGVFDTPDSPTDQNQLEGAPQPTEKDSWHSRLQHVEYVLIIAAINGLRII